jgi:hypothetical protein
MFCVLCHKKMTARRSVGGRFFCDDSHPGSSAPNCYEVASAFRSMANSPALNQSWDQLLDGYRAREICQHGNRRCGDKPT